MCPFRHGFRNARARAGMVQRHDAGLGVGASVKLGFLRLCQDLKG
jgi:hypothetical protein